MIATLTRARRTVEAELIAYKRTWRGTVISSFVNPVFFLSAMGLGLGSLVDRGQGNLSVSYLTFVATGLMAAIGMQAGAGDGAHPVMAGIKWRKEFHAVITTPMNPGDIVVGRAVWGTIRLTFIMVVFTIIAGLFGAFDVGTALMAIPPAVLTGIAFQTSMTAFTATREDSTSLTTIFRFAITPLFLFSGTFFPIANLPQAFQWIAYATPLFHGVELVRKIALPGIVPPDVTTLPIWVHFAYLGVMLAVGITLAARFLDRRLRP
ncbi:MAG: ABC transporter permease [Acidimicrobiales bacterium]|jgi:lipooligosaccharide transport system permease protein|nr:ABC transporter permease [Acidimicrobiales bacterium]HLV89616.1 ABC transporter permease [Acidimicrobiia bacterium]